MQSQSSQGVFGRAAELNEIYSGLEEAIAGRGSVFLVSGEPGIGKTRLAREAATIAEGRGFRSIWGRCWDNTAAPAFWPWIQILRAIASAGVTLDRCRTEMEYVAGVIPELRQQSELRGLDHGAGISEVGEESTKFERFQLFDTICRILHFAAQETPLLLIIDDCHTADDPSLVLLNFVARELQHQRLVLLVTYRDAELRAQPHLEKLVQPLLSEACALHLRGLRELDIAKMLNDDRELAVDPSAAGLLYRATEGNPFFLVQLVRSIKRNGRHELPTEADLARLEIPDQLRSAIRQRLNGVSARTKSMLEVAAVIGVEFEAPLVATAGRLGVDEVAACINEALDADLVDQVPETSERYRFSHSLFRETLYSDLNAAERKQAHLNTAAALEAKESEAAIRPGMLAYHCLRALPLGQVGKAIEHVNRAADKAMASLAWERAVSLHEDAIRTLKAIGLSVQAAQVDQLIRLGLAQHRGGHHQGSGINFLAAMELARDLGDAELFARAVLGRGILPSLPGKLDPELVWGLEEALRIIAGDDRANRALLLSRLAEALQWDDPDERRINYCTEAVGLARKCGSRETLFEVIYHAHVAMSGPNRLEQRLDYAGELVALAEELGNPVLRWRASFFRLGDLLERGDMPTLDREIENYKHLTQLSHQQHFGLLEAVLAMRALMDGRFDEAENYALKAMNLGNERRDKLPLYASAAQFGAIKREQAKLADLLPLIESFVGESPNFTFARCGLAFCCAELGRREQAEFHFNTLARDDFTTLQRNATWLSGMFLLAEVCRFLGDEGRAAILYRLLAPYASLNAAVDIYVAYGPVHHALGILATLTRNFEDAELHFEEALRIVHTMGSRPLLARTQYQYAEMLVTRGVKSRREYVDQMLESALEKARVLKMVTLAEKARHLAVSHDGMTQPKSPSIPFVHPSASGPVAGTVTILFSDIENSTQLFEQLGDIKAQELISSHNAIIRLLVRDHGGSEVKTTGDGFMMAFPSARQALLCAIEAQRKLECADTIGPVPIRVRIGIHTGEAISECGDYFGKCVIIAARLMSLAKGAEILVSSTTKEMIESAADDIYFDGGRALALKGLSSTYTVYGVIW